MNNFKQNLKKVEEIGSYAEYEAGDCLYFVALVQVLSMVFLISIW